MDDMISRSAAIEALSTPCDKRYRHGVWETCLDNIETAIRNIPAVKAAPVVHARWVDKDFPHKVANVNPRVTAMCSKCGSIAHRMEHGYSILSKFCPYCGAKMDEEGS